MLAKSREADQLSVKNDNDINLDNNNGIRKKGITFSYFT